MKQRPINMADDDESDLSYQQEKYNLQMDYVISLTERLIFHLTFLFHDYNKNDKNLLSLIKIYNKYNFIE